MDRLCIGQNYSSDEVVRGVFERKDAVFCPKPRRLGQLIGNADGIKPLRFHFSHQPDLNDSTAAGAEILDIILTQDSYDGHDQLSGSQVSSSPPYFCGSPPSRSANPLVHDARFLEEKHNNAPLTPPFLSPSSSLSPSAGARKGGCARPPTKFGPNPAVRIEGFDCLNRDSCGCGIPAVA